MTLDYWIIFAALPIAVLLAFEVRAAYKRWQLARWHKHLRKLPTTTVERVLRENSGEEL